MTTTDRKRIYFIAGLPRSGSTLLANILAQHPAFYVTPTSGIIDMLVNVRNHWDQNEAFRAMDRNLSEQIKKRVMQDMLQAYFAHAPQAVCIDKNRFWCEFLEMAAELVGSRERVKVIITVRDLRDVLASFEQLYRKTSGLGQLPQENSMAMKFKTAKGRLEVFADDSQPVGRAYNAIRDAVTRGWLPNMHFVEYNALTTRPKETMQGIYQFLGEDDYQHNFDHVEQVTTEDDFVYGFKDLHTIRNKVAPQASKWASVYDDTVFQSPVWKNIQNLAEFWKLKDKQ
ncbi:sulfotransferase [Alteromonadaceae bacterium BrNp21-10]|nr:sulfotransferase [Alteromonadaceae bacterium BrNp21-10]